MDGSGAEDEVGGEYWRGRSTLSGTGQYQLEVAVSSWWQKLDLSSSTAAILPTETAAIIRAHDL